MAMKIRVLSILLVAAWAVATAAPAHGAEPSWPCYRGVERDNKSAETGLMQAWPKEGPPLLWTAPDLGHGYSSVAVAGGRIFTSGMTDKKTFVVALDPSGKQLWRRQNGESWQATRQQSWAVPYSGARGTPTVDGDTVYHLSEMGRLAAFDVATGDERWHVDLIETFKAPRPKYGYAESVLILGERLICCPGGETGYIAALNKRTGKTLWANPEPKDPIGYASPVAATIGGMEQIISVSGGHVFAIRPDTGASLWQYAIGNSRSNNATDVIVHDGQVFASSGYGTGCMLLKPERQADGRFSVKPVWTSKLLDNHHGGVLLLDGCLYGAGHESKGWFCLKFATGQPLWQAPGKGSLTYADHRLYCLDEKGTMSLLQATPEKWTVAGSFTVPSGGHGDFWAHPVVCGGRLYLRHSEKLFAYQIAAR